MFGKLICAAVLAVGLAMGGGASAAEPVRIALHVDDNDAAKMNLALNNAVNLVKYYEEKGREVQIEVVANGPGLHMLREDSSPVADRLMQLSIDRPEITFAACANTRVTMEAQEGHAITLLDEASEVPSGVVHLTERQMEGWAYLKP